MACVARHLWLVGWIFCYAVSTTTKAQEMSGLMGTRNKDDDHIDSSNDEEDDERIRAKRDAGPNVLSAGDSSEHAGGIKNFGLGKGTIALSDEKELIRDLLLAYEEAGVIGRPVRSQNETLDVGYGLSLIQIMDLDEKNQVLTTNVWCKYQWHDILLQWNPHNYSGVTQIRIPSDKIWKPDIVLYNYADERLKEHRDAFAIIYNHGDVIWIPPAIFKSTCPIDTTNFPFDEQKCKLKFGSWTYMGTHVDPKFYEQKEYFVLEDYLPSQEWIIKEHPARKHVKLYECCLDDPYPDLTFYLRLRRKAAFYNYILLLPCVLLSTITMVLFMLPPESPAKMQLGINIFVAFFLLLLLLKDTTPPASAKIPLIGAYYCFNMIMTTVSTFLCAIVVDLHFRADKRSAPPKWLKIIMVEWLAKAMCMKVPPMMTTSSSQQQAHPGDTEEGTARGKSFRGGRPGSMSATTPGGAPMYPEMKYNKFQMAEYPGGTTPTSSLLQGNHHMPGQDDTTLMLGQNQSTFYGGGGGDDKSPMHFAQSAESDIREIRKCIKQYLTRIQKKESKMNTAGEWRVITMVLDRLFFYLYIVCMIISLSELFPRKVSKG